MATPQNHANQYLATRVLTASPAELRLMLLDGAVRFCRQGREGLAGRNFEAAFNGFTRCRNIIMELMTTMKPDPADPSLCDRLRALYGYMVSRLLTASHEKDLAAADEVVKLLEFERETWVLLMNQLQQNRAAERPAHAQAVAAANAESAAFTAQA